MLGWFGGLRFAGEVGHRHCTAALGGRLLSGCLPRGLQSTHDRLRACMHCHRESAIIETFLRNWELILTHEPRPAFSWLSTLCALLEPGNTTVTPLLHSAQKPKHRQGAFVHQSTFISSLLGQILQFHFDVKISLYKRLHVALLLLYSDSALFDNVMSHTYEP